MHKSILFMVIFAFNLSSQFTIKRSPNRNMPLKRAVNFKSNRVFANPNTFASEVKKAVLPPIVIPDMKPILDVIEKGGATISSHIELLVNGGIKTIEEIINKANTNNITLVEPILLAGNDSLKKDLSKLFTDTITSLTEFVDKITSGEITETTAQLNDEMKAMLLNIDNLFTSLDKAITDEISKSASQEKVTVTKAINDNNNTVKDQIITILNDPNNNKPILGQLIYPDPKVVTDTITSIKKDLLSVIVSLVDKLDDDALKVIATSTTNALAKQKDIVDMGNKAIIDEFTAILNKMAEDVTPIIENISKQEIDSILPILESGNEVIGKEIIDVIGKMNSETDKVINDVTVDEINQISVLLAKNNDDILQQVLPILNVNNNKK